MVPLIYTAGEDSGMIQALIWALRIYKWLIIVWAVMTWIPGLSGSAIHDILGLPILPLMKLFSWASIGPIGLGAVIIILGVNWLEGWLIQKYMPHETAPEPQPEPAEPPQMYK